jgi:hypothetical protein
MSDQKSFSAGVTAFVAQTKQRLAAVARQSTQDVIDDAQLAKAKGGRMPIQFGFLRNSGTISYAGLPIGPSVNTGEPQEEKDYSTILGSWDGATDIWWGWTAEYALHQETLNGYLRGAVLRWSEFVANNSRDLEARINARRR